MHPRHRVTSSASAASVRRYFAFRDRTEKKRPKLITFGVNDRFAADGTIDRPLDTIKSRPFIRLILRCPDFRGVIILFIFATLTRVAACAQGIDKIRRRGGLCRLLYEEDVARIASKLFPRIFAVEKEFMPRNAIVSRRFVRD